MTRGTLAGSQTTLRSDATVAGIGVHSGSPVTLTLHPAEANTGVVFLRSGPNGQRDRELVADYRSVTATEFATVLGDETGPAVSTTEHVLAALHGLGVDNVVVEVDGPEVPIMDGSAEPFVAAIDQAGIATLTEPRRYVKVLKAVHVGKNGCSGELRPYARGLRIETEIDFDHPLIGRQKIALDLEPQAFRRELSRARTFGFMRDVTKLWNAGYALGASFVCRVESTKWPVCAALIAISAVSRSRISPTMMTSGSCRTKARNAVANVSPIAGLTWD